MNRTYKIAFALFLLLVISLAWLESSEPEPINWSPSYTALDKIPLGAFIFFENWKEVNPNNFTEIQIPPYEYLNDSPKNGTYFFLNDQVSFDDDELDDLLAWVSQGNKAFISSYGFGENLEDSLDIELSYHISSSEFTSRPELNLVNPQLRLDKNAQFDQDLPALYFEKIDTTRHIVLGTSGFGKKTEDEKVNFIEAPFGKGTIYLHTVPQAFSNYFLLKDENYRYAEAVLAYFSSDNILWDAYYKSGKSFYTSPLYILLNNRALKWAYYFVLIAAILFIIFEGKRKQRPIPVIEPLKNKSFEFTETLSQLYLEQERYYELGLKKIGIFLEYLRIHHRLDTSRINNDFYTKLAAKSGNSLEDTTGLFKRIFNFQENKLNTRADFFEISKSINSFKEKNGK